MSYLAGLIARSDARVLGRATKLGLNYEDCAVLRLAILGLPASARALPSVQSVLAKVETIQAGER